MLLMVVVVAVNLMVTVVGGWQVSEALERQAVATADADRAIAVRRHTEHLLALLVDAETGQRGYLLTGDAAFLEPYESAVRTLPRQLELVAVAVEDPAVEDRVRDLVGRRSAELTLVLAQYDQGDRAGAVAVVAEGVGKQTMDQLRSEVASLTADADADSSRARARADHESRQAVLTGMVGAGIVTANLVLLLVSLQQRRRAEAERQELLDRLAVQARTDPLTGLLNRRALEDRLIDAVGQVRQGRDWWMLYLDLDGFKPVNDRLGHERGDAVLRQVADGLSAVAGERGAVARVGGDEFVVLVPSPVDQAPTAGGPGSLLAAVRGAATVRVAREGDAEALTVGASVGEIRVSTVVREVQGSDRHVAQAVLARADRVMYLAKHGARDDPREPVQAAQVGVDEHAGRVVVDRP